MGFITAEQEEQFREGISLNGRRTAPAGLKLIKRADNPWYEVRLTEGRQNQIRLMFKHFGRLVEKLRRVKIGFLELDVKVGEFRQLTPAEVARFKRLLKWNRRPSVSDPQQILKQTRTIAVVGLSSNPLRPSFGVSRYMQKAGFKIIPVNPQETEVLGEKAYASLDDVPVPVDMVNVFRLPRFVPEIVDAAIRIGAKSVWMQMGISHEDAARAAEAAGLQVVMDRCLMIEHMNA